MSTRALLSCGVIAGPLYMLVYLVQAFTRPGFDITRHPASVLSNGDLGWIQVANFVVTGALVIALALGMRRARSGPGGTWGPLLIGLSGVGLLLAAAFSADPVDGFPPDTPLGPPTSISTTGLLHFVAALVGFVSWIVAGFVFARRYAALGQSGWAAFSAMTGALLLAGFIAPFFLPAAGVIPLVLGVALMWAWLTALAAKLLGESSAEPAGYMGKSPAPAA